MKIRLIKFIFASLLIISTVGLSAQNSVSFFLSQGGYCEPSTVFFNNTSYIGMPTGIPTYEWRVDGMVVDNTQYPSPQILNRGDHYVELIVRDDNGDLGYSSQNVNVYGTIDTFYVTPSITACPGEQLTFSVNENLYSIEWDFGEVSYFDDYSKYQNNAAHTYNTEGIYTVNLTVSNDCGTSYLSQDVEITPTAIPEFSPYIHGNPNVCPNEDVYFDVNGDFSSYLWVFGDGSTSTLKSPTHSFPDQEAATYTVFLTVTNECGNSNTKSIDVSIGFIGGADAGFDFYIQSPYSCPGSVINFNSYSSGTHQWKFGDGGESSERNPVYRYSQPGFYSIEHIVVTGCGVADTMIKNIDVQLNPSEIVYNLNFVFDVDMDWEQMQYLDTLTVCPGEVVSFRNDTWYYDDVTYNWSFGDGSSQMTKDAKHIFDIVGLHKVILTATTGCGGVNSVYKYVNVDPLKKPEAPLGAIPLVVCPDETVYFFDNNYRPKNNLTYHIDFGDGTSLNDIRGITDYELQTLASHPYSGTGPFIFSFKAENTCGNFTEYIDTVIISTDVTRKPFYYVGNSTDDGDNVEPADWSVKTDATDHKLDIFVQWDSWQPSYGNVFYLYFWYEGIYMEGETGPPNGVIQFTSTNISAGETVEAWIPMNMMGMNEVGMVAAYYCDTANFDNEPENFGVMMDAQMNMINKIPITPGGYTNITDVSPMGIQFDPSWDGICKSDKIEGRWFREVSPGVFAVLDLYEDMPGSYYYNMDYRDDIEYWSQNRYISSGSYNYPLYPDMSVIEFQDYYCGGNVQYSFTKPTGNQLQFSTSDDACNDRVMFLEGIFEKFVYDENENSRAVCPGDKVKFQIVGGKSYLWDFGDGTSSIEQYPVHIYSVAGVYDASVTATNHCGRIDIFNTKVNISSTNIPDASFGVDVWELSRLDTAWFRYYNHYDYGGVVDNNTYLWDFGDGTTSTLRDPYHVFTEAGEFLVKLQVTNSCGTNSSEEYYYIKEKVLLCEAKFIFTPVGLNVGFTDYSLGNPTKWNWDFGDGKSSIEQNPNHTYTTDGVYYVTLTTFNELNNCVSSVVRKLIIGTVTCDAGFTFVVNNTTKFVKFTNTSLNTGEYFWDFGDHTISELKDPEKTYKNVGVYTVCLTVFDIATGCQSIYCEEVIVGTDENTIIKADFSYFLLDDGLSVTFSDLSAGNITSWYWTTGDGKMITKSAFIHKYPRPGIYKVCLVVFDEKTGNSNEICKTIRVGDIACNLSAEFDFFVKTSTKEVILEDKSVGNPEKWYWTFGDGTSSEKQSPVHKYKIPGFYLITLSVFDATNDCMDRTAKFIQIGDVDCRAEFETQINPETYEVKLINKSTGPIEKYYWDFGNGKFSTLKSPSVTYSKPGKHIIGLTVIDSSQVCLDYLVKDIQVGEINCSAAFDYYVDSTTATAFFQNKVVGAYSQMMWIFGDGTYSTKANPVHQFTAPGYYTVSLNTFNIDNDCMDYFETVLLVGSEGVDCKADFIYQPGDLPISVRFKDKSMGDIQNMAWSFGDGSHSEELNPVHDYPETGYYLACLTVWNNFKIPSIQCRWIPVAPPANMDCRASFMFSVDSISRKVVFVDNSVGEPDTWRWELGDGSVSTEQNPQHTYTEKGFYTVKLISSNSLNGCKSNEVKLLNVGEDNKLKASFAYEVDSSNTKASGYPVDFVGASSGDAASYEWDFGDENLKRNFVVMDSLTRIVTYYYESPGTYNACLRVSDPITGQSDTYCEEVKTKFAVDAYDFKASIAELSVFPNPASDFSHIRYTLPETIHVEIAIFDAMGRRIETLVRTSKEKGNHEVIWDSEAVSSGLFFIKLMTSKQIITQAIVINK